MSYITSPYFVILWYVMYLKLSQRKVLIHQLLHWAQTCDHLLQHHFAKFRGDLLYRCSDITFLRDKSQLFFFLTKRQNALDGHSIVSSPDPPLLPGFLFFLCSLTRCLAPVPLFIIILIIF